MGRSLVPQPLANRADLAVQRAPKTDGTLFVPSQRGEVSALTNPLILGSMDDRVIAACGLMLAAVGRC